MTTNVRPSLPKVYTIASDRPFLAALAAGLLEMAAGDPLRLPRVTILLPTRRAVRSLREAFLRATPDGREAGTPLLLPIGDLDADEISLAEGVVDGGDLAVAPAIPELRRRLLLTRLVLEWGERRGKDPILPGEAAALAASLARLLDIVATEGAGFEKIDDLVPENLAEHWQIVLHFLKIVPQHWPRILAEEGALDPAERRNQLLERQATIWRSSRPRDPIIAAGLLGGLPALTGLLSVIATLDQGAVILPGLDRACADDEWLAIGQDEAHPQYLMAGLLEALGLTPAEVPDWRPADAPAAVRREGASANLPLFAPSFLSAEKVGEAGEAKESSRARRVRLLGEAMRPATTTDAWRRLPPEPANALDGLSRYDCASPQSEAVTIALLLRRKL